MPCFVSETTVRHLYVKMSTNFWVIARRECIVSSLVPACSIGMRHFTKDGVVSRALRHPKDFPIKVPIVNFLIFHPLQYTSVSET